MLSLFVVFEVREVVDVGRINLANVFVVYLEEDAATGSEYRAEPLDDFRDRVENIGSHPILKHRTLARVALHQGDARKAMRELVNLERLSPREPWALWELAELYFEQSQPSHSLRRYQMLKKIYGDMDLFCERIRRERFHLILQRIRAEIDAGERAKATNLLKYSQLIKPENWMSLVLEYELSWRYKDAGIAGRLKESLATASFYEDTRLLPLLLPALRVILQQGVWSREFFLHFLEMLAWYGDPQEVLATAEQLLHSSTANVRTHMTLGLIAERANRFRRAREYFRRASESGNDEDGLKWLKDRLRCIDKVSQPTGQAVPDLSLYAECLRGSETNRSDHERQLLTDVLGVGQDSLKIYGNLLNGSEFEFGKDEGYWNWIAWPPEDSPGSDFVGGFDAQIFESPPGSMRITSTCVEPEGRAGFWYVHQGFPGNQLILEEDTCYLFSFDYATRLLHDSERPFDLYFAREQSSPSPFFSGARGLPPAEDGWSHVALLGCAMSDQDLGVKPLIFSRASGSIWIDNLSLKEVTIPRDKHRWGMLLAGSFQTRK